MRFRLTPSHSAHTANARPVPPNVYLYVTVGLLCPMTILAMGFCIGMIVLPWSRGPLARRQQLWLIRLRKWSWSRVPSPTPNGILAIALGFLGEAISAPCSFPDRRRRLLMVLITVSVRIRHLCLHYPREIE